MPGGNVDTAWSFIAKSYHSIMLCDLNLILISKFVLRLKVLETGKINKTTPGQRLVHYFFSTITIIQIQVHLSNFFNV